MNVCKNLYYDIKQPIFFSRNMKHLRKLAMYYVKKNIPKSCIK